ncbi:hypothetical protein R3P38DRAFT_3573570 [Favolaschia claudopus]|uniref:SRR1-like domain-containing protein n=1 Tax=Favolaschia claudopus TaxID=2862362 RepID=A0AAW0AN81_9AGAR
MDAFSVIPVFPQESFAPRLPAPPSWTIAEEHNGGDWSSTASAWSKEALFNRPDLHAIIKQLDSIEFNETTSQTVTIAARGQPFSVVFDLRTGCRGSMEAPPNCEMTIKVEGRFADGERVVLIPYQLAQNYVARDMLTGAPFQSWKSLEFGQAHARLERELEASSQDSQFSQMIVNLHEMTGSCKIRRIVAFACGTPSFVSEESDPDFALRSVRQHALIIAIKNMLESREKSRIEVYAQDPAYSEVDKELLNAYGISVIADPRGFLRVTSESIVVSISPNIPIRQIVADISRPAVIIWDRVEGTRESATAKWTDPESERVVQAMRDDYNEMAFTSQDSLSICRSFHPAAIYLRKAIDGPEFDAD